MARQKAQEYSERLPSIFNAAGREKIPFEAVYPYADAPFKPEFFSIRIVKSRFDIHDAVQRVRLTGEFQRGGEIPDPLRCVRVAADDELRAVRLCGFDIVN